MIPNIFISRELEEDSVFLNLEANIYAASQIQIQLREASPDLSAYNWIFFSSKNAVRWALQQRLPLDDIKIAAIGKPTQEFIESKGFKLAFCGKDASSVTQISEEFNTLVSEEEKVLFPLSSRSKKTILSRFDKAYDTFIAYSTEFDPILFDLDFDYFVFTSPSNFQSFFTANRIQPEAKIIAIGETTKAEISKYLNIPIFTPKEKTEISIYELLQNLMLDTDSNL